MRIRTSCILQEAELLATLCHPCVTTMYGVIVGLDGPSTVMEFVRGGSLRICLQQLKTKGGASASMKIAIALQASRGAAVA